jgi:hypothetical protein
MAWWFVLRDASEPDIVADRETKERLSDQVIPSMVAGGSGSMPNSRDRQRSASSRRETSNGHAPPVRR